MEEGRKNVSIALKIKVLEMLVKEKEKSNRSFNHIINDCIEAYLTHKNK